MPTRLYHEQEAATECSTVTMTGQFSCPQCGHRERAPGVLTYWVQGGYVMALVGTMRSETAALCLTPGDIEHLAERLPELAALARAGGAAVREG